MSIHSRRRAVVSATIAAVVFGSLAACSSGSEKSSAPTSIAMWARSANAKYNQAAVDAYNKTSAVKVKLTSIPDADFLTKLSTASASGTTPDLVAVDVVYGAKLLQTQQLHDITAMVDSLPYRSTLAPSYLKAFTQDGKIYGVPQNPDASALFYNKDLFAKAGLNPEKPPTSWHEIATYSAKIAALGNGIKGFYFSGNCANCNAYTFVPQVWASGSQLLSSDGKSATFDTPQMRAGLSFYHGMWQRGEVPSGARTDTGANFLSAFQTGKVGIEGLGAFAVGPLSTATFKYGVAPLPGQNGGAAALAGGDVLAIPAKSVHAQQAFDFIKWFLSDQTQVDIVAKNGGMTARTDLADNKYAKATPALVVINKLLTSAQSPSSTSYNELFNDPNGPFATAFQKAVFDGDQAAVSKAQQQMTSILQSAS